VPSSRTVAPGGVPVALGLTAPVTPTFCAEARPAKARTREAVVQAAIAMRRGLMMSPQKFTLAENIAVVLLKEKLFRLDDVICRSTPIPAASHLVTCRNSDAPKNQLRSLRLTNGLTAGLAAS